MSGKAKAHDDDTPSTRPKPNNAAVGEYAKLFHRRSPFSVLRNQRCKIRTSTIFQAKSIKRLSSNDDAVKKIDAS
jgi:hypothetical protein